MTIQSRNLKKPFLATRLHGYKIINKKYNQNIHKHLNWLPGYQINFNNIRIVKKFKHTISGNQVTWLPGISKQNIAGYQATWLLELYSK